VRGMHMTANWPPTTGVISALPDEWFEWLRDVNAEWVGISISLYVRDPSDSTISREYEDVPYPTFTDEQLTGLIAKLKEHGFKVYMTLTTDQDEDWPYNPLANLGNPTAATWPEHEELSPSDWRWDPTHPDHEVFVAEFWDSYTAEAVHFAELAEREGVDMFSLGTEADDLFKVTPGPEFAPQEWRDELMAMVEAVRAVYRGPLTYDQQSHTLDWYADGYETWDDLWDVLGLDVIGLSWYLPLVDEPPTEVLPVEELEAAMERVYQEYLVPLAERHPDLPIMLLEFGFTNTVIAPWDPTANNFQPMVFDDANGNGIDDGDETQANLLTAFFNVAADHPGIIDGVFMWEHRMANDNIWSYWVHDWRMLAVRQRPAESVVQTAFETWRNGG